MSVYIGPDSVTPEGYDFPELDRLPHILAKEPLEYDSLVAPQIAEVAHIAASTPHDLAFALRLKNGSMHTLRVFPAAGMPESLLMALGEYAKQDLKFKPLDDYAQKAMEVDPFRNWRPVEYYLAQERAAEIFPDCIVRPQNLILNESGRPFAVSTEFPRNWEIANLDVLEAVGGETLQQVLDTLYVLSQNGIHADLANPTCYMQRSASGEITRIKLDNLMLDLDSL